MGQRHSIGPQPKQGPNSPETKATKSKTLFSTEPTTTHEVKPVYVGKCDYDPRTSEDLGFKKGDRLNILNTDDEDWWLAQSESTGQEGYIPRGYVTELKTLLDTYDWYFGDITRDEAVKLLHTPFSQDGFYLIRKSFTNATGYAIAIFHHEQVRHYRVKELENGTFFVTRRSTFDSIQNLVAHYQQQADGLISTLLYPCPRREQPHTAGLSRQANKEWDVDKQQITLVKQLSADPFGDIWEGLWNGTTEVAIKTLKPDALPHPKFLEEISFMRKLRHPNLVQVYAVCTKEEPVYIVMELARNGNLLDYLHDDGRHSKLHHLIDIMGQVATGMAYLEGNDYVHGSLVAKNVFCCTKRTFTFKVANFGLVRAVRKTDADNPDANMRTAPETVLSSDSHTIKSDVWSFGIILYRIITFGHSIPHLKMTKILGVVQPFYEMPRPLGCPDKLYEVMLDCWKEDPVVRPTFETLEWQMTNFFVWSADM